LRNRLVARKLRLSLFLFAAAAVLWLIVFRDWTQGGIDPATDAQLTTIQYLLVLLGLINAGVALGLNPLREDRVPDRFPAIVQDAIVIALFLIIATLAYPEKLFTTSAVGAVVVGFALQDTLGNAFAGLAIQIEKPFRVGHWIAVGQFEGRVSEITWRATRLRTKTGNFVIVPNSVMSKEAIINYSEPISPTRLQVEVGLGYDVPPNRAKEALIEAVRQAPLALRDPAPDVLLADFAASSLTYRVRFWISDFRHDGEASDQVRTAIFYALKRAGLEVPYPIQIEYQREDRPIDADAPLKRRESALAGVPMFSALTADERAHLAAASEERHFGAGERIVRQSEPGESMFVLVEGSARVFVEPDTEVAIIDRGGCFGEMSLLTGEPRTASVQARVDCVVLEISPDAFNQLAVTNPAALERVTALAAERRGPLEQARLASLAASPAVAASGLLARMRRWMMKT
jgi:small-conductance mechanosensitive channel/CRP-like cAMP-binding protein